MSHAGQRETEEVGDMKRRGSKGIALMLVLVLALSLAVPDTAWAAKKRKPAIKRVELRVGGKKVNGKAVTVKQGSKTKVQVVVKPGNAKKSVKWSKLSSKSKRIATISKSGVISAKKKNGTVKMTVTVKGKNGKSKKAWLKVKVVKSTVKKPVTKNPATTKPSKPAVKPVEPSIPSKPEVDWKTCQHDWGVGCKHEEVRTTCNQHSMDYEDIYHHFEVEEAKDFFNSCGSFSSTMVNFYECNKCGAGKKHIQDWNDPATGRDFIFETYAECLQFTPY